MDINKLVSCIVPVLNEEDTISDFITSLHTQDYRPIELILVDGGSKDRTLDIINRKINEFKDDQFSIRFLIERDFGNISSPANAKNIGLDHAKGEFVFFIDSDTRFIIDCTISTAILEMGGRDIIIIYFKPLIDTKLEDLISKTVILDGILIYRKILIENLRFDPTLGYGEDREFSYRLFGNFGSRQQIPSTIEIGRHYPHTLQELRKQNEWYGRTILRYLRVIYPQFKVEFLEQLTFIFYNLVMFLFPLIILTTLVISLKIAIIFITIFFIQSLIRFFKYERISVNQYFFFIGYLLFNGFFFTKGLISSIYKKNNIGRMH